MSKQSEMEDIEYESSVSSNLSFLNENEEIQVPESQKTKPTKKSNNNSPQKTIPSSKLQKEQLKDKSSKQDNIEEEVQPETVEKEKVTQPNQQPKLAENKSQEKQAQPETVEGESAKKKEESNEMEQEDDEQPAEEQEEGEEANFEDEANNNNAKESEEEIDDEKEDEEQDEEEEGQEAGNNQKDGKENDNATSNNQNTKKKGQQQVSSGIQKRQQQKGKGNSNTGQNSSKQNNNNNSNSVTSAKQNNKPGNSATQSNSKGGVDTPSQAQNQKLNQKRTMAQRLQEEAGQSNTVTSSTINDKGSATSNGNATTTPTQVSQASTTNGSTIIQPAKPTKKLSSKFYLYKEGVKLPDLSEQLNQTIEVRVSKEYIHRFNKQYLSRSIWGSDNYTSDSDIVCILIHHGLVKFDQVELQKDSKYAGLQVFFTVSKNRKSYVSQEKNNITSRLTKTYQGFTIKPNSCTFITTLGTPEDLTRNAALMCTPVGRKRIKPNHVLQSRNILAIPEANIVFNLSNDPAQKYSIINFCDKSDESKDWMSHKLQTHALYIETDKERYEISRVPEGDMNLVNEFDAYKFSRVKEPNLIDNEEMQKLAIPLPAENVELIYTDLDWSDFKWGSNVVFIKDHEISLLKCFKLYLKNQLD